MSQANHTGTVDNVLTALKTPGKEVVKGKGGFHVKGEGFLSLREARRLVGIKAPARQFRSRQSAFGDWTTVKMINRPRKQKR